MHNSLFLHQKLMFLIILHHKTNYEERFLNTHFYDKKQKHVCCQNLLCHVVGEEIKIANPHQKIHNKQLKSYEQFVTNLENCFPYHQHALVRREHRRGCDAIETKKCDFRRICRGFVAILHLIPCLNTYLDYISLLNHSFSIKKLLNLHNNSSPVGMTKY